MKNINIFHSFFLGKEKERKSNVLLLLVGVFLVFSYVKNSVVIFDDLYIPRHYSDIVTGEGWLRAAVTIFTGGDLSREYRTYGLSRLMQFSIWSIFGGKSLIYPVLISISQILTSLLLIRFFRKLKTSEPMALFVALAWLVSPFFITWTFHHYSYLIFPFQVWIFTVYLAIYAGERNYYFWIPTGLGVACALTGEMHLPAALLSLLFLSIFPKQTAVRKFAIFALLAFLAALFLHRLNWVFFIRDNNLPQRFSFQVNNFDISKVFDSVWLSIYSIYLSFARQIADISGEGLWWGGLLAIFLVIAFLLCIAKEKDIPGEKKIEIHIASGLLLVAIASFSLYVLISVTLGEKAPIMPRRYGYIPLTLIAIAISILLAEVLNLLSWPSRGYQRIGYAIALGAFLALSGQFQAVVLTKQRKIDAKLTTALLQAKMTSEKTENKNKSVLFFVASDSKYWEGLGDGSVLGPKMESFERRELFESPWGIYWTAKSYSVDFLGFEYSAMVSHCKSDSLNGLIRSLSCDSEWAYPMAKKTIDAKNVIVMANLSLEKFDPNGEWIKIFHNYAEFEPNNFSRRIERDALKIATTFSEDFSVDLGQKDPSLVVGRGVVVDKLFTDHVAIPSDWVANYGLIDGGDAVYSHPDIRSDLASYKTNRNGAFSYEVEFKRPTNVEVSLDFWEQWGRKQGERVFYLQVSWDGVRWADVGAIDMAAINQDAPFSIILKKKDITLFSFRLKPAEGTKDVPVIQNIRLRRI
ncbi:hypothetical protein J2X19_000941 [Rhodoferax ferrireducens]|uniref:F5/8 type C domain-containing protein n=1 Tax=Rhodoferax ferrireducens TaxID=192843 RepID=A0ABU2C4N9_9BURK|nr:hypothetical protein [Rhodoferax ferrireducens]MDR7376283.1 hypothetical protein [Rhodoferax ferrireducens]